MTSKAERNVVFGARLGRLFMFRVVIPEGPPVSRDTNIFLAELSTNPDFQSRMTKISRKALQEFIEQCQDILDRMPEEERP